MHLSWTPKQANIVAEKMMDAGNLALGVIVFAEVVAGPPYSFRAIGLGFGAFVVFYVLGHYVMRGGE